VGISPPPALIPAKLICAGAVGTRGSGVCPRPSIDLTLQFESFVKPRILELYSAFRIVVMRPIAACQ